MEQIAIITFRDRDTSNEAIAIVRRDSDSVAISLSHEKDGDIQVVMGNDDAQKFADALRAATA